MHTELGYKLYELYLYLLHCTCIGYTTTTSAHQLTCYLSKNSSVKIAYYYQQQNSKTKDI